jgi:hypothetical protein
VSAQAVGWVYRHSPLRGTAFQVHLAIADSVNDQNGYELWMAQPKLARKARVGRASCQRALDALVEAGLLELVRSGSGSTNLYRLLMPVDAPVAWEPKSRPTPSANPPHGEAADPVLDLPHGEATPASSRGDTRLMVRQDPPHGEALTQEEPKEEPKPTGRGIASEVWERRKAAGEPTPALPFVAVAKIGDALLEAGHAPEAIVDAMLAVPTISTRWVEGELAKRRPKRTRRISENRDAPEGRLAL